MTVRTPATASTAPGRDQPDESRLMLSKSTCSTDDCDRRATVRGMCGAHYQKERRLLPAEPCVIGGCDTPRRSEDLCAKHYTRYRRHGTTDDPQRPEKKSCGVEACDSDSRARGWCNFHYRRWVLTGSPEGYTPGQERKTAARRATRKTCTKCQQELPLDAFAIRTAMVDGRRAECRECIRKYNKMRHEQICIKKPPRASRPKVSCMIEGCTGFAHCRGWCKGHYERWRRNGSPTLTLRSLRPRRTEDQLAAGRKTCSKCKRVLPIDSFSDRTDAPDGKSYICRTCMAVRSEKVRKRYTEDDVFRGRRAEYHRKYRQKYREDMQERQRAAKLWINYGMTLEEYEALYRDQGGVCRLCGSGPHGGPEWARKQWLSVDHDHATGRIRGLLCDSCNIALGKFKDNAEVLRAAIEYLGRTAD